ncbi:hypothetical protein EVAR_66548_1, partial [Eumeta japonica]
MVGDGKSVTFDRHVYWWCSVAAGKDAFVALRPLHDSDSLNEVVSVVLTLLTPLWMSLSAISEDVPSWHETLTRLGRKIERSLPAYYCPATSVVCSPYSGERATISPFSHLDDDADESLLCNIISAIMTITRTKVPAHTGDDMELSIP